MTAYESQGVWGGLRRTVALVWAWPGTLLGSLCRLPRNRGPRCAAVLTCWTLFAVVPVLTTLLLAAQWIPATGQPVQRLWDGILGHVGFDAIIVQAAPEDPNSTETLSARLTRDVGAVAADLNRPLVLGMAACLSLLALWGILRSLEGACHDIWHETGRRPRVLRLINDWVLVTVGPLLLALGLFLATAYRPTSLLGAAAWLEPLILLGLAATAALLVLYLVLPTGEARVGPALLAAFTGGALLAALAWIGHRYLARCLPANHALGLLALAPTRIVGLFLAWLAVLYGMQVAYGLEHLGRRPRLGKGLRGPRFMASEVTVTSILREIARHVDENGQPVPSSRVLGRLGIPACLGERILNHLVDHGYLVRASAPVPGFLPTGRAQHLHGEALRDLVARVSYGQRGPEGAAPRRLVDVTPESTTTSRPAAVDLPPIPLPPRQEETPTWPGESSPVEPGPDDAEPTAPGS